MSIDESYLEFVLSRLLATPSPTGYHLQAVQLLRKELQCLHDLRPELCETPKGALTVTLPGASSGPERGLAGHIDTLGAMVRQVKKNGRLMLTQLGSYAWQSIEGENVTVICVEDGRTYRGSVQTVHPSVHTSSDAREGKRDDESIEVRLDERTSSRHETLALGIDVGDIVALDPRTEWTASGFVKSRHLDDKAGVAVILTALRALTEKGEPPHRTTQVLFSNYEEVGHGAAGAFPSDVDELLVVDMAASTTGEYQNSDEYTVGICAKDSSGPYDLGMRQRLVCLCRRHEIPYRIDTYPHYGSDGSAMLRSGAQVRVGLVGPGIDASHAYERTHKESLAACARLVLAYLLDDGADICT